MRDGYGSPESRGLMGGVVVSVYACTCVHTCVSGWRASSELFPRALFPPLLHSGARTGLNARATPGPSLSRRYLFRAGVGV